MMFHVICMVLQQQAAEQYHCTSALLVRWHVQQVSIAVSSSEASFALMLFQSTSSIMFYANQL